MSGAETGASPERELWFLMECAESPFGLGAREDYQWHADRPGESPAADVVRYLVENGYVTLTEGSDPHEGNPRLQAEITSDGRERMDKLLLRGVKPEKGWI